MDYLGATLTQVFAYTRNGRVTQRCHNRKWDGKRGYGVRMMSCTGSAQRICGDLKNSVELKTRHQMRRVDFRDSQRPDEFARYGRRTRWGVIWKSQNRKNVHLSPYVEEPLNSKVIKSFVPELRSRKCFSCFEIPMFYVYMLWTFYVRFPYFEWLCYICVFFHFYSMVHGNGKLQPMTFFFLW